MVWQVANETVFFYHEDAFADTVAVVSRLERMLGRPLQHMRVTRDQVSLAEAVATYLFNSQLVSLPQGGMALIAPVECQHSRIVRAFLEELRESRDNPVTAMHYLDVRESMQNGGGPACLRLRVAMTEEELAAVHPHVLLDDVLYNRLTAWVRAYYRDALHPRDLADPLLVQESREALEALQEILQLTI